MHDQTQLCYSTMRRSGRLPSRDTPDQGGCVELCVWRVMLDTVAQLPDLAARIRRAREDAGLRQAELAEKMGVHYRTVQGWEAGRHPRTSLGLLERTLHVDLTTPAESASPRIDTAADSQLIAALAGRLADRERRIAELTTQLETLRGDADLSSASAKAGARWAARRREAPDNSAPS